MIDAITSPSPTSVKSAGAAPTTPQAGGFDAALQAAQKAEARRQAQAAEEESIKTKGFTAWARDTQLEALKEKLRKQIMAEMGVDADQLSRLTAAMRQILEQKIEQEVERRVQEEEQKQQDKGQKSASSATQPIGKNDQGGKSCPVIPALVWPGAASLF